MHGLDIDRWLSLFRKRKGWSRKLAPFAEDYEGHEDRTKEREEEDQRQQYEST